MTTHATTTGGPARMHCRCGRYAHTSGYCGLCEPARVRWFRRVREWRERVHIAAAIRRLPESEIMRDLRMGGGM